MSIIRTCTGRLCGLKPDFVCWVWVCCGLSAAGAEWPYCPLNASQPPTVDSDWGCNGIDAFVLRKLTEQGLQPARTAEDAVLVRRLYFDLIGLPPSPDDIRRYLEDSSEDRWESLVNRLLDDPRYGERWGRLWLDLARYADTAGYEGDPDLPHVWRYRDYVIDAFNTDKPYDEFVREQIAGDEIHEVMGAGELPAVLPDRTVALTFLRLAPFTEPRGDETRHEMLSEITSTVGSVFLGLTVGCAKCHDHKHDEISTKDFYRMKAFFATVSMPPPEPGDIYQIGGSIPAAFYRDGEKDWADRRRSRFEREIKESAHQLEQLRAELTTRLNFRSGFGLQTVGQEHGNDYVYTRSSVNDGKLHCSVANCDGESWTFLTDSLAESDPGVVSGSNRGLWFGDLSASESMTLGQYSGGTRSIAADNPYHGDFAQILIYDHPLSEVERNQLGQWLKAGSSQAAAGLPKNGLRVWFDASDLDADPGSDNPPAGSPVVEWTDRVSNITLVQNNPDRQPVVSRITSDSGQVAGIRFEDDFLAATLTAAPFADDQQGSIVVVYSAEHSAEGYGLSVGGHGEFISTFVNPGASGSKDLESALEKTDNSVVSVEERKLLLWLSDRERMLGQQIKRLDPVAMSLRHSFGPPFEPGVPVSRVMIRGEYDNPGEVVEPGFLSCITGNEDPADIRLDPFKRWPTRSRRIALAEWIAGEDNPMTARVLVNRLWHWHFGRGIVSTPSDFGQLSGGPSHQELLDWLSGRFLQNKWSIKSIHRLILTSATWRQTSIRVDPRASEIDPNNTLLWRHRRQRLDAETIRDAILTVSGRLNPEQYGLPVFPPLPDDIEQRVKYSKNKWDTQTGPEGRKRSIYIYQQRTLTMPFMQVFDALVCDESRPRRRYSVTPLQALAMYNGRLVNEEAKYFAQRVRLASGADASQAEQIVQACQIALGRPPTEHEQASMAPLFTSANSGLESVCRVLMNSNEFIFVD
ncbi:MAG: DUF1549 and DUF1553 domain-containing protein [Fuerstiella sp.]|nr:DUF1549 and DUF1553 domain-containing protein [Fuerstiella sp.]